MVILSWFIVHKIEIKTDTENKSFLTWSTDRFEYNKSYYIYSMRLNAIVSVLGLDHNNKYVYW